MFNFNPLCCRDLILVHSPDDNTFAIEYSSAGDRRTQYRLDKVRIRNLAAEPFPFTWAERFKFSWRR